MARDQISVGCNQLTYIPRSKMFIVELSTLGLSIGEIPVVVTILGRILNVTYYYTRKGPTGALVYTPTPTDEKLIPECQGTSLHVLNT